MAGGSVDVMGGGCSDDAGGVVDMSGGAPGSTVPVVLGTGSVDGVGVVVSDGIGGVTVGVGVGAGPPVTVGFVVGGASLVDVGGVPGLLGAAAADCSGAADGVPPVELLSVIGISSLSTGSSLEH